MAPSTSSNLGNLVRLRALKPAELPSHPDLASQQTTGTQPDLTTFLDSVLKEAETFTTTYLPRNFKVKSRNKPSPPSAASVELLAHDISSAILPTEVRAGVGAGEAWFARTSIHENAAKEGTASWEEFDNGLRKDHSIHEKEYTPDVRDAHLVLNWSTQLSEHEGRIGAWEDVQAEIREMQHKIPPPLNNRVFSVLVVTARKSEEFIVVQIPVLLTGVQGAQYVDAPKMTAGQYVSIELGQLVEEGAKVKWQMATASDAKGNLPMWAQKMGVPGAVVKDVGLFLDWSSKRRAGKA